METAALWRRRDLWATHNANIIPFWIKVFPLRLYQIFTVLLSTSGLRWETSSSRGGQPDSVQRIHFKNPLIKIFSSRYWTTQWAVITLNFNKSHYSQISQKNQLLQPVTEVTVSQENRENLRWRWKWDGDVEVGGVNQQISGFAAEDSESLKCKLTPNLFCALPLWNHSFLLLYLSASHNSPSHFSLLLSSFLSFLSQQSSCCSGLNTEEFWCVCFIPHASGGRWWNLRFKWIWSIFKSSLPPVLADMFTTS